MNGSKAIINEQAWVTKVQKAFMPMSYTSENDLYKIKLRMVSGNPDMLL